MNMDKRLPLCVLCFLVVSCSLRGLFIAKIEESRYTACYCVQVWNLLKQMCL